MGLTKYTVVVPDADMPHRPCCFLSLSLLPLCQYDHAYTLESREERMEILMSALWRGVFMNNESIKEPHVRVIAEYMDSELSDVYEIGAVRGACLA